METLIKIVKERAEQQIETIKKDFEQGQKDCRLGYYDKWFRYHRDDEGLAYDKGWAKQNNTK